jgi:hypothetical protein
MLLKKRTLLAIAFAGTSAAAGLAATAANADPGLPLTIRPLQGASFDIGTKRAVSYFLSDNDAIKLTLMLAEPVNDDDDEANGLADARMTVAVEGGKAARLDTAEGKSVEFTCRPGGQEMSIEVTDRAY